MHKANSRSQKQEAEKCSEDTTATTPCSESGMNYLWQRMEKKYHDLWISRNGQYPFRDGNLTMSGCEWSDQLKGLRKRDIETGLNKLAESRFKQYPPNAMCFAELCTGDTQELVLSCVLARIEGGERYKWTDRLAYTFWARYSFVILEARNDQILKLIKQNLKFIPEDKIMDLPNYDLDELEDIKKPCDPTIRENYFKKIKEILK